MVTRIFLSYERNDLTVSRALTINQTYVDTAMSIYEERVGNE